MLIRCPKCERVGHLPDRLAPEAHSLRCRKCQANFLTTDLAIKDVGKHLRGMDGSWRGAMMKPAGAGPPRTKAGPFLADGTYGRFDEASPPLRALGPGDSNYEMTFSLDDAPQKPDLDWEEEDLEAETPSSDEIEAINSGESASQVTDSWFYPFLVSWGRALCLGVLGFVALSVLVIAFLVASSLLMTGRPVVQALIVASIGTIALLLIAAAMTFQSMFLIELVKNVHRINPSENRPPRR